MSWWYRRLVRPWLFLQDPEEIHERTLAGLGWAARHDSLCSALQAFCEAAPLPVRAFGLDFPNPVGVAAGMDKQAHAVPAWEALGFGHIELGAVTWLGQPGNPSPRAFRAIAEGAIINRMGFNNPGAETVAQTLAGWRERGRWPRHPVGMNLGKSKVTPLSEAAQDYARSFTALWPHCDFFVVNVSSPNTPNLRQLQDKSALDEILAALQQVNTAQATSTANASAKTQPVKPILVKVAPDLTFEALDEIVELIGPRQIAGLVATNTTIRRPESADPVVQRVYAETGGLSGRPLRTRSTEVIRHLYRQTQGRVPIVGVGGVFDADDAWEKITAGATLLQVYTGMVYEGPTIAQSIVGGVRRKLAEAGLRDLSGAVGLCEREAAPPR